MILQFCTFAGGNEDEINLPGVPKLYENSKLPFEGRKRKEERS